MQEVLGKLTNDVVTCRLGHKDPVQEHRVTQTLW